MARTIAKRAPMPIPVPTEAAIREQARQEALDEADRTMLATLVTLDRRQQAQGEMLMSIATQVAEIAAWVRAQQQAGNGHAVDPLARTMPASQNGDDR
jgi:hypothetical protein